MHTISHNQSTNIAVQFNCMASVLILATSTSNKVRCAPFKKNYRRYVCVWFYMVCIQYYLRWLSTHSPVYTRRKTPTDVHSPCCVRLFDTYKQSACTHTVCYIRCILSTVLRWARDLTNQSLTLHKHTLNHGDKCFTTPRSSARGRPENMWSRLSRQHTHTRYWKSFAYVCRDENHIRPHAYIYICEYH